MAETEYRLERGLPASVDAERSILGGILMNAYSLVEAQANELKPEHFSLDSNRRIYSRMLALDAAGAPIDLITLADALSASGELQSVGNTAYLSSLYDGVPRRASIAHHLRLVKDKALMRGIVHMADAAIGAALDQFETGAELLGVIEGKIAELRKGACMARATHISEAVAATRNRWAQLRAMNGSLGMTTGVADLDRETTGIRDSEYWVIAARPNVGKSQPLSEPVLTATGWKPIGELKPGDELASIDGAPSLVMSVHPQGELEIFEVTFSDGRTTRCCAAHLWKVFNRKWPADGSKLLETREIARLLQSPTYKNRISIPLANGRFGEQKVPLSPWLLGYLLGNGCLTGVTPMVTAPDCYTVEKLNTALGEYQCSLSHKSKFDYRIVATGKTNRVAKIIASLGLQGHNSFGKFIPAAYLSANADDRASLLCGLLDSDGEVSKNQSVIFHSSCSRLANDVAYLARSLGAVCNISVKQSPKYVHKGDTRIGRPAYRVLVRSSEPYKWVSLPRRRDRLSANRKEPRLTISAVHPVGREQCVCIRVSHPSGLYITRDFIVTHNTPLISQITLANARLGKRVMVFSQEMSEEQLTFRCITHAGITTPDVTRDPRKLSEAAFEMACEDAADKLSPLPIWIYDGRISISELKARAAMGIHEHGIELFIVDYLQLVRAPGKTEYDRVTAVSRGIDELVEETGVPCVAASQLNRNPKDPKSEPMLGDLRSSGEIEQDADVVVLIHRPPDETGPIGRKGKLLIAKQREGCGGFVEVEFSPATLTFRGINDPEPERQMSMRAGGM